MLLAILLFIAQPIAHDHVDLVELNAFYDCNGRFVYEQVIFYEWRPDLQRYHVRAWCLVDDRDLLDRRPQRGYRSGLWVVRWQDRDQNVLRTITATHYRRSWSQVDPERANKRLLPESERRALIKRLPPQPIPDPVPMLEDWSGE
jgi:hypothetical protein